MTVDQIVCAYDTELSHLFDTHVPVITRTKSLGKRDPCITKEALEANRKND